MDAAMKTKILLLLLAAAFLAYAAWPAAEGGAG